LNRLSQAHGVGQQQADARHGQGSDYRLQLVRVNLDRRIPDAQQGFIFDPLRFPQSVQPGPAVGVDERLEGLRAVGPVGIHAGQVRFPKRLGRGFDFPQQLLGLGIPEVVQVFDFDDVQPSLSRTAVVRFHRPDRRQSIADPHGLSNFGGRRQLLHPVTTYMSSILVLCRGVRSDQPQPIPGGHGPHLRASPSGPGVGDSSPQLHGGEVPSPKQMGNRAVRSV